MAYIILSAENKEKICIQEDEITLVRLGEYAGLGTACKEIKWLDEDGDLITIETEEDVREAVRDATNRNHELNLVLLGGENGPTEKEATNPSPKDPIPATRSLSGTAEMDEMKLRMIISETMDEKLAPILKSASATENEGGESKGESKVVHEHVICDNCEKKIVGIRYKCGHCPDFDLCQKCEELAVHDPSHLFIKVRNPVSKNYFPQGPVLACSTSSDRVVFVDVDMNAARDAGGLISMDLSNYIPKSPRKACDKDRLASSTRKPVYKASFVSDVTLPDGCMVKPGSLIKVWKVKNSGPHMWPKSTVIKYKKGDKVGITEIQVPQTAPGHVVDVRVPFTVSGPSSFKSFWQLSADGCFFGDIFWMELFVDGPPTSEVSEIVNVTPDELLASEETSESSPAEVSESVESAPDDTIQVDDNVDDATGCSVDDIDSANTESESSLEDVNGAASESLITSEANVPANEEAEVEAEAEAERPVSSFSTETEDFVMVEAKHGEESDNEEEEAVEEAVESDKEAVESDNVPSVASPEPSEPTTPTYELTESMEESMEEPTEEVEAVEDEEVEGEVEMNEEEEEETKDEVTHNNEESHSDEEHYEEATSTTKDDDDLPPNWERRVCVSKGCYYYVDHSAETTTWKHPRESGHPYYKQSTPATSAEPEPTLEPENERMKSDLDQLLAMGFFNRTRNHQLLKQYNGDMTLVINQLISDMDDGWVGRGRTTD
eukprot:m.331769 g.331769  ORF g.331769 m.331769 type:complete len:722 (+) comp16793_c0_seq1:123-2288(+)